MAFESLSVQRMERRRFRRLVGGVALVLLAMIAPPLPARAGTSGTLVVTTDTTLTEDHAGDVVIAADGVTLDCDGHSITGPGTGNGILLSGVDGTTVANCLIQGFDTGVAVVNGSSGNVVSGSSVTGDGDGIGFLADGASGNTFDGNVATGNTDGFVLIRAANDNVVAGNAAVDNWNEGIKSVDGTLRNTIVDNTVSGSNKGVVILDSEDLVVERNMVSGAVNWFAYGLGTGLLGTGAHGNLLADNTAAASGIGFLVDASTNNVLSRNASISNSASGVELINGANDNTVVDNWVSDNGGTGVVVNLFQVTPSTGNTFSGNRSHANDFSGFDDQSAGSAANSYTGNLCVGNGNGGSSPGGLCDPGGAFVDDDGLLFELDIEWMAWEGITKGCNPPENDRFCPGDDVSRGQMAAFLVRAMGYTDDGGGDIFVDDDDSVFEADIDKLATAGVTKGCNPPENDRYCPTGVVTRGQMAAFLHRALGTV